jgi:hypothetical protein
MPTLAKPIRRLPQFLYIEPTTVCNLHCKMCYTNVINGPERRVVESDKVLSFVRRFATASEPPLAIYWCGTGEVFLHKEFPQIVNTLQSEFGPRIEQTIQTNGTIRRLDEIDCLSELHFRVSIDGSRQFHEWHRGENTYDKTLDFCREAVDLGCRSMTIRALLTRDNIGDLVAFEEELKARIGPSVILLVSIPYTNSTLRLVRIGAPGINPNDIDDHSALSESEARELLDQLYGGRFQLDVTPEAVDNYLSLTPYGVHTCCHGIVRIGDAAEDIGTLNERLVQAEDDCLSCAMFPCQ